MDTAYTMKLPKLYNESEIWGISTTTSHNLFHQNPCIKKNNATIYNPADSPMQKNPPFLHKYSPGYSTTTTT